MAALLAAEGSDVTRPPAAAALCSREAYVPLFSLYAILIYFCILREDNDIDEMMEKGPLYDKHALLVGLGKKELEACLEEYRRQGLDGTNIIERLAELELEAKAAEGKLKRTRT